MSPLHRRFIQKIKQKGFHYLKETKTSRHYRRFRDDEVDEIFLPKTVPDEVWIRITLRRHRRPDNPISNDEIEEVISGVPHSTPVTLH